MNEHDRNRRRVFKINVPVAETRSLRDFVSSLESEGWDLGSGCTFCDVNIDVYYDGESRTWLHKVKNRIVQCTKRKKK